LLFTIIPVLAMSFPGTRTSEARRIWSTADADQDQETGNGGHIRVRPSVQPGFDKRFGTGMIFRGPQFVAVRHTNVRSI
jgi:hypothetical protein